MGKDGLYDLKLKGDINLYIEKMDHDFFFKLNDELILF